MIYRLKAPTRQAIEGIIPFDLYVEDGQGSERFVPATEDYSYVYRGHEVIEDAEYDSEGSMTKEPVLSNYVRANINIYNDKEINVRGLVERVFPDNPRHGWR